MKQETPPIKKKTVYLPADVDERLRRVAQLHRRSFNSELVWALEQYLEQQEREHDHGEVKKP
jgi:predicted transcriptional regulator